jgi:hypothetical protein
MADDLTLDQACTKLEGIRGVGPLFGDKFLKNLPKVQRNRMKSDRSTNISSLPLPQYPGGGVGPTAAARVVKLMMSNVLDASRSLN